MHFFDSTISNNGILAQGEQHQRLFPREARATDYVSETTDTETTYEPTVGDVVLIDTSDRRIRGTWAVMKKTKRGKFKIKRYGKKRSTNRAKKRMTVKPIWLKNLVGAVLATVDPATIK